MVLFSGELVSPRFLSSISISVGKATKRLFCVGQVINLGFVG